MRSCVVKPQRGVGKALYVAGGLREAFGALRKWVLWPKPQELGLELIACNGAIVERPVKQRPISRLAGRLGRIP